MTCDDLSFLADDYVDRALDPATIASAHRHLSGCRACRTLVEDVTRIRDAARALGPIAPPARVWAGIQAQLADAPAAPRRGWPHLLAAAAGFVLVLSGLWWLGANLPPQPGAALAATGPRDQFEIAEAAYQSAIDDLESITTQAAAPAITEPALVALQAGLVDLDEAIDEARGRLSTVPDDEFTQDSLLSALDTKVVLLQETVALLDQERADLEGWTQ
jgi:hypothetical protein